MTPMEARTAALSMRLRELGDCLRDLYEPGYKTGNEDAELIYLAAAYIDHLEAVLAKIGRALGNST